MASVTIPDLEDTVAARLQGRTDAHGRTVEAEATSILRETLRNEPKNWGQHLLDTIRAEFGPLGGVELDLPPRHRERELPRFDDA